MKKYVIYSNYGILNGKFFVQDFLDGLNLWNISEKELQILSAGPENPAYRDTWNTILKDRYFEENEKRYHMEEDENFVLFLIEK